VGLLKKPQQLEYYARMSDEQPKSTGETSDAKKPQQEVGLMLQRLALYRLQRESEKPPRSPKRIALVSIAVLITMSLFLVLMDKSVKVAHRVIDIWAPVIFDAKKSEASSSSASSARSIDPSVPYMIRVEPSPAQSKSAGQSNQSSSQSKR